MGKCQEMFGARPPVSRQMQVVGLRKLYLVDLVSDALNGPLGLSVFVLLGCVARTLAGPSVIISVVFAAVVAIIAGESCGAAFLIYTIAHRRKNFKPKINHGVGIL